MENSIETHDWVKYLLDSIVETSKKGVLDWCTIVMKIGMDESMRDKWSRVFERNVQEVYQEMIEDVTTSQNILADSIEELLKKSEQLCKDLQITMPKYGVKNLSLYEEKSLLLDRIKEYEDLLEEKHKEISALKTRQNEICTALGRDQKPITTSPLPSPEFMAKFKDYLDQLEGEKYDREEKFIRLKEDILGAANELHFHPSLDFEKMVLNSDDSTFQVTDHNMSKLTEFHKRIIHQVQDVKEEIRELKQKVQNLWEVLDEDLAVRTSFFQEHSDCSLDTLVALKDEIHRCEIVKRANIEKFVKRLRDDLVCWWDKCHFTQEERKDFLYFQSDVYTEDLLTLHDLEIDKVKKYYNEQMELLTLLERREKLWNKMLGMEDKAAAPDRYKNRGGQLLKEERERNVLSKKIPEIEEQLKNLAQLYEEQKGKPFLSWGQTVDEIINKDYEEREQGKKIKLSSRKQNKTITPGKTCLGITAATSTINLARYTPQANSTKRKLLVTPSISAKRSKVTSAVAKSVPTKLPTNTKSTLPRYSTERNKRIQKLRRVSRKLLLKNKDSSTSSTQSEYDVFQKAMTDRKACNSTLSEWTNGKDNLAVPLATTPKNKSSRTQKSPHTASKLSTVPKMKLLI